MADYEPDDSWQIDFNLEGDYSPDDSWQLDFNLGADNSEGASQYINPEGLDAILFGQAQLISSDVNLYVQGFNSAFVSLTHQVYHYHRWLKPAAGIAPGNIGRPSIKNFIGQAFPSGIAPGGIGKPLIQNWQQFISLNGIPAPAYDYTKLPKIDFLSRKITVTTGIAPPLPASRPQNDVKPEIGYGIRYRDMKGFDASLFGQAGIYYNPRFLEPRGIFTQYNAEHKVSPKIIIRPEGFDAARFGSRIIPESQTIYPFGFQEQWGENGIHNYIQYVVPKGFLTVGALPEYRWGNTYAYNLKQIITQKESADSGLNPPTAGKPELFNRNRQIKTHGHDSQRFGFQLLENGARVLGPTGIASPIEIQPTKSFIAYKNRKVTVQGIDHPFASNWHHLVNAAALIQVKGFDATRYGVLGMQNTRRYFRFITGGEMSQYGTPMISHGIRHIQADPFYAIGAPLVPMPRVENSAQYIQAKGFDSQQMGWLESHIRWNRIYPRYSGGAVTGEPVIQNRNVHPKSRGFDSMEFGNPGLEFYNKTVRQHSFIATLFGRLTIGDSKRFLQPASIKPVEITRFHEIYEIGTGRYPVKRILPLGFTGEKMIGSPTVLQNNIIVKNDGPFTRFGNTEVRFLGARVEPGIWEMNWGVPRVEYKTRTIHPQGKDFMEFHPERQQVMFVSAHTIYAATPNVPSQAIKNHDFPNLPLHHINGYDSILKKVIEPGARFGNAKIDHYHRYIKPLSLGLPVVLGPEIRNTHHVIAPKGFNALRMGNISPLGDQTVLLRSGIASGAYGRPTVRRKTDIEDENKLKPSGIASLVFGRQEVQHFNRSLMMTGFESLAMGVSSKNDKPYQWQSLHVGPPMPTIAGGDNHQLFGTAWVSLAVREISPEGNDFAVVNEYDLYAFQHRMKVWNADKKEPSRQQVYTQGFVATSYGVPNIKHAAHYIRPDGNSEQYRKGAPSKDHSS